MYFHATRKQSSQIDVLGQKYHLWMILTKFLYACTTQAPFRSPEGKLFLQIEGFAMGSRLVPTFVNFYVGNLEE